jgi:hypothetical protein
MTIVSESLFLEYIRQYYLTQLILVMHTFSQEFAIKILYAYRVSLFCSPVEGHWYLLWNNFSHNYSCYNVVREGSPDDTQLVNRNPDTDPQACTN